MEALKDLDKEENREVNNLNEKERPTYNYNLKNITNTYLFILQMSSGLNDELDQK